MRADVPELLFATHSDFRAWLQKNAETSECVWLIFSKTKAVITLSANDALEEALCFGWIDGQMQSIDETKYHKYFARRRTKSVWSEKNKKVVEVLRAKGMMTELGEKAVETAIKNGIWNTPKGDPITDEQIEAFGNIAVYDPGGVTVAKDKNIWLQCFIADLDAEYERLLREIPGIEIISPPERRPWGTYSFWFADPDGNKIAVAQERKNKNE